MRYPGEQTGGHTMQVQQLAQRTLPEVEALIARAEAMKRWLTTATSCNCQTLDVCGLFEDGAAGSDEPSAPATRSLQLEQVGASS